MNELVETILISGPVSAFVSIVLVFLAKTWISERVSNAIRHEYDLKLEAHKVTLQCQHELELTKLRSNLEIAASEQRIRFTSLNEKVGETVGRVYERLTVLHQHSARYVSIFEPADWPSKKDRRESLNKAFEAFRDYYQPRKIFLPPPTTEKINAFHDKLLETIIQFAHHVERDETVKDRDEEWTKAFLYVKDEVPALLAALEADFRYILGWSRVGTKPAEEVE